MPIWTNPFNFQSLFVELNQVGILCFVDLGSPQKTTFFHRAFVVTCRSPSRTHLGMSFRRGGDLFWCHLRTFSRNVSVEDAAKLCQGNGRPAPAPFSQAHKNRTPGALQARENSPSPGAGRVSSSGHRGAPVYTKSPHPNNKEVANRGRSPTATHKKLLIKASLGNRNKPPTGTRDRHPQYTAQA